jgi:hypothetical protein
MTEPKTLRTNRHDLANEAFGNEFAAINARVNVGYRNSRHEPGRFSFERMFVGRAHSSNLPANRWRLLLKVKYP